MDTYSEQAHIEGLFYKNVLMLKIRTRNFFYLGLMLFFGFTGTILMGAGFYGVFTNLLKNKVPLWRLIVGLPLFILLSGFMLAVCIALLVNFAINLKIILFGKAEAEKALTEQPKERMRRLPKRRKDYH